MTLVVATCQFPVSADVARNAAWARRQLRQAATRGAHVAHFPETCLAGYVPSDRLSYDDLDWDALTAATRDLFALAGQLGLWLVVGSVHRLGGGRKPLNCVYVVDDGGRLVDRYDKRYCELEHYSPGDHCTVFEVRGVRGGVQICHDFRYPELYREYKRHGVQVMFHSFHAGGLSDELMGMVRARVGDDVQHLNPGTTIPGITMPAGITSSAANNAMWVSCPNTSARESLWPSFVVRPDGVTAGRLRRHVAGVLVTEIDPAVRYYDSTVAWRDRTMDGVLHGGEPPDDPRAHDRTHL